MRTISKYPLVLLLTILVTLTYETSSAKLPFVDKNTRIEESDHLDVKNHFSCTRKIMVRDGLSQNMVYCILQDSRGFLWFGTQDGLNRFDGTECSVYRKDAEDPYSPGSNKYFSIYEDKDSNLWLGTADGVFIYNPSMGQFYQFEEKTIEGQTVGSVVVRHICEDVLGNIYIVCQNGRIFQYKVNEKRLFCLNLNEILPAFENDQVNLRRIDVDSNGWIWAATYQSGVIAINTNTREYKQFLISNESQKNDVNTVLSVQDNRLLVGSSSFGVLLLDKDSGKFTSILQKNKQGNNLFVRQILRCSDNSIWIGTESGVYIFNPETSEISYLCNIYGDPYSLSDNAVHSLYEDADGGVWVGTYFGGVNYVRNKSRLERFYYVAGEDTIEGKRISEFCQDDHGYIWIATEDAGLFRFNPILTSFRSINIPAKNLHALYYDDDKLWVGSFSQGLYILDINSGAIKSYGSKDGLTGSNSVYSIYKDSKGNMWVGTMAGLYQYMPETDTFINIGPSMQSAYVIDIIEDDTGKLWFATNGDGMFSFSPKSGEWKNYENLSSQTNSNGRFVICLHKDAKGKLWAGTEGAGLFCYDADKDTFVTVLDSHERLSNDVVYSIESDKAGNLWGGTNRGLYRLDCKDYSVMYYQHEHELQSDQFNYKSGMVDGSGKLYFGTTNGFISFYPENMFSNIQKHNLYISSLQVNNIDVEVGDSQIPILQQSIMDTRELVIPHQYKTFSLRVSEISFMPSSGVKYYYQLEGWNNQWILLDLPGKVTYSNLPYGKYVFRVKDHLNGKENLISMNVVLKPPFYLTPLFKVLYGIVAVLVLVALVWAAWRKYQRTKEENLHRLTEEKEKEIYKAKIEFFSNITHEIRTPLSLIKMPLENIIAHSELSGEEKANLVIIQNNTDRLINLVNQLLDFRKLNGQQLDVQFVHVDFAHLVQKTLDLFGSAAQLADIELQRHLPQILMADVDVEMSTKMVSNLMSNAMKHAAHLIDVTLVEREGKLILSIMNDGDEIPEGMADKIFKPYFKLDEKTDGFGIGLPFTRSLAELHKGTLVIDKREDHYAQFTIELPLNQENTINFDYSVVEEKSQERVEKEDENSSLKSILLVDDDDTFLDFMVQQFKEKYNIIRAADGEEALQVVQRRNVDLILSDFMMPHKNGIELCHELKSDQKYCHIPFLLLTGETSTRFKSDAMIAGVDAYLEKPFSLEFLEATIENYFRKSYLSETSKMVAEAKTNELVYTKADEAFFDHLTELITAHLEETDLDVNKLADMMNMSRATLYRKVKESLKVTPNDYIRIIRLKKAAELLRKKEYRINEIAFIVGFSSSSYFSKCFFKQYGILPKDFC